jgi:hypothetical protein
MFLNSYLPFNHIEPVGRSLKAIGKAHQKIMRGQFGFEILKLYTIRAILLIEGLTTEFIGIFRIII